jgi:hypothetical protein
MKTTIETPELKEKVTLKRKRTTPKQEATAKPAKSKEKLKEELDTKNIKDTVKQVVESTREIRYKYPEEINNQLDRKAWRQKTRNKMQKFESDLLKEKDEKKKGKLNREYLAFRKEVLMVP